jgi:hypothetical protein
MCFPKEHRRVTARQNNDLATGNCFPERHIASGRAGIALATPSRRRETASSRKNARGAREYLRSRIWSVESKTNREFPLFTAAGASVFSALVLLVWILLKEAVSPHPVKAS